MKKLLILMVITGLLIGSLFGVAEAKKKKKKKRVERTIEVTYDGPAIGVGAAGTGVCIVALNSCGNVATGAEDLYMTVEVTDAAGQSVLVDLGQDSDPDALGTETDLGTVCGASEEPIPVVEPGLAITTFPWAIGSPDCPGFATTGTIKFTFSNMP